MAGPRVALIIQFGILLSAFFLVTYPYRKTLADSTVLSESETKSATTGTVEELLAEGRRHQEAGQVEAAIEKYKVALALAQSTQGADKIASLHLLLGSTYGNLGRWQEAVEAYKEAIRIKPDLAEAHYNLGWVYDQLGRYQEAIEAYRQVMRLKPDDTDAYLNLGVVYGKLGHYQEAVEVFKQAIRLKPDFVEALYNLGVACGNLWHYEEAIQAFEQAIRLKPDLAEAYVNLGAAYYNLGRDDEATEALMQAGRIKPDLVANLVAKTFRIPDDAGMPDNPGQALIRSGRFSEALLLYQQQREKAKERKNTEAEAKALIGLAQASDALGDVDNVSKYFLEALKLCQQIGDPKQEATVLVEIGHLHQDMSRYDEALNFYHQALSKYREAKDQKGQGVILAKIGEVHHWIGDTETALRWYQDALEASRAAHDTSGEIRTLAKLWLVEASLGNEEALQEHMRQAVEILQSLQKDLAQQKAQTGNDFWAFVQLAQTTGQLQARQGSPDDAIFWLSMALQIHQAAPRTREFLKETAVDFYYLAGAYIRLERYDEALRALQQAAEIAQQLHSPELYWVLDGMGFVQEKQGRLQEALGFYTQATEVLEKVSFQQRSEEVSIPIREVAFQVYQHIVRLLSKLYAQKPELHYVEQAFLYYEKGKARVLLDLLEEAKVRVRKEIDPALLKEEEQITTRISRLHRALADPELVKEQEKQLLAILAEQEQAWQTLQVKIAVANPKYAELTSPQVAGIPQIQAILDKETLLLECMS